MGGWLDAEGDLGSPTGAFRALGGPLGEPRGGVGVLGRSLGAPGGPWETPGGSLGRPWAVLGAIGASSRRKSGQGQSPPRFWTPKGAKWEAQGTHFEKQNRYNFALKF